MVIMPALSMLVIRGSCVAAVDETSDMVEKIEDAHKTKSEEVYSEKDYQHDLRIAYIKGGVKIARLYTPSVLLGIGSLEFIFCSLLCLYSEER